MQLMRCGKFLVEINLVSNHLLGYVDDPDKHPFPIYLRQGIPCCLCTDDRGMWDSNMTDEFYFAVSRFNLSWEEIIRMGRHSIAFSFAPKSMKNRLQKIFDERIGDFESRLSAPDWRRELRSVKAVYHGYAKRNYGLNL